VDVVQAKLFSFERKKKLSSVNFLVDLMVIFFFVGEENFKKRNFFETKTYRKRNVFCV